MVLIHSPVFSKSLSSTTCLCLQNVSILWLHHWVGWHGVDTLTCLFKIPFFPTTCLCLQGVSGFEAFCGCIIGLVGMVLIHSPVFSKSLSFPQLACVCRG